LQILRERSRTLSNLSAKAEANMTDDAKVTTHLSTSIIIISPPLIIFAYENTHFINNLITEPKIIRETSELNQDGPTTTNTDPPAVPKQPSQLSMSRSVTQAKLEASSPPAVRSRHSSQSGHHHREKIPIILEMLKYNSSIRFPDRRTLEELIEYVNADMSNKFTLIINSTISRPGTSSGLNNLPPIGRRASRSYSHSNAAADFENGNDILMTSQNDEEFFKVLSLCFCCLVVLNRVHVHFLWDCFGFC